MSESDVALALEQPWVAIDNDSQGTAPYGILGREHPHPRAYGTFPRILRNRSRRQAPELEDAIRKFGAPRAEDAFRRPRRTEGRPVGRHRRVRPRKIPDVATFADPNQLSTGMDYVLVNGVAVIDGGQPTEALPGKVLRGPGSPG